MLYQPSIPTHAAIIPTGPDWQHEIKHDGYRLIVQREGERVRLFTRRGLDWTNRFPLIIEAARRLQTSAFVIDGEAVWLDDAGMSQFDRLHSRKHDQEVQLITFDLLVIGGHDVRREPLHARKARLQRLVVKSGDGILLNPHLTGEIGPAMFEHACKLGLEGIVSKHRNRPYRSGPSTSWIKVKNPAAPAIRRLQDGSW